METENTKTELLLYNMVQQSKQLLQEWTHTSYLNKEQKLRLRRRTRMFLHMSSTSTLCKGKLMYMGAVPSRPKELFDLLNNLDPEQFKSYEEFREKFVPYSYKSWRNK